MQKTYHIKRPNIVISFQEKDPIKIINFTLKNKNSTMTKTSVKTCTSILSGINKYQSNTIKNFHKPYQRDYLKRPFKKCFKHTSLRSILKLEKNYRW